MSKKMTTTIARALAEKVRVKLQANVAGVDTTIRKKIESSKEWKQLQKLQAERKAIIDQMEALEKHIEQTYTTGVVDVQVSLYSSGPEFRVRENYNVASVDAIKDTILVEDYMSGGTETAEQLIDRITNKLINP